MNKKSEEQILEIISLFTEKFEDCYSGIKKKGKTVVLEDFYYFFRKWFYSAFLDENILTPAHIVYRINEHNNKNNKSSDYFVPVLKIKSKKRYTGFDVNIINYNINNHPIVDDLKIFAEIVDIVNIYLGGIIVDDNIKTVLKKVSIDNEFYLEFLLNIGLKLKLFKRLPSIHTEVFCVCKNYAEFFQNNSKRECFEKIVDAAIDYSCEMLNAFFPDNQKPFTRNLIIDVIKKQYMKSNDISKFKIYCTIDLVSDIYSSIGFDVKDIIGYGEDGFDLEMDEFTESVISSVIMLETMIDKLLITVMGDFLQLIMPIYMKSYSFEEKIAQIFEVGKGIFDFECPAVTTYYCTPVACDLFNFERPYELADEIFSKFSIDDIFAASIAGIINDDFVEISKEKKENVKVYEIKISFQDEKKCWKILEIEDDCTLAFLHFQICKMFFFEPSMKYSFFFDKRKSPFSEYTSKFFDLRPNKKTETTLLSELNLNEKQVFIYTHDFSVPFEVFDENFDIFNLEIEVLKIKDRIPNAKYPHILKESKAAKELGEGIPF